MWWTVHVDGGPRRVNHAAVAVGRLIYSFGGYCTGDDYQSPSPIDGYVLDTLTNRWTRLPEPSSFDINGPWPYRRYGHALCASGPLVYLFGGRIENLVSDDVHVFDTRTSQWTRLRTKGPRPLPRDGHCCCIVDGKMYVVGGYVEPSAPRQFYDAGGRSAAAVHALDLETARWEELQALPVPLMLRDFHTATPVGTRIYIFGGRCVRPYGAWEGDDDDDGGEGIQGGPEFYSNAITYLETTTGRWVVPKIAPGQRPEGRRSHSAVNYNGDLLIFGGYNSKTERHKSDLWLFRVRDHRWEELKARGEGPGPRRRQAMCLSGTKAFIFGGTSPYSGPPIKYTDRQIQLMPEGWEDKKLIDHSDMYVLDLAPTLRTISLVQLARRLALSRGEDLEKRLSGWVPCDLLDDLGNMLRRNSISDPLETLASG